jgi:hypothetical protein
MPGKAASHKFYLDKEIKAATFNHAAQGQNLPRNLNPGRIQNRAWIIAAQNTKKGVSVYW